MPTPEESDRLSYVLQYTLHLTDNQNYQLTDLNAVEHCVPTTLRQAMFSFHTPQHPSTMTKKTMRLPVAMSRYVVAWQQLVVRRLTKEDFANIVQIPMPRMAIPDNYKQQQQQQMQHNAILITLRLRTAVLNGRIQLAISYAWSQWLPKWTIQNTSFQTNAQK